MVNDAGKRAAGRAAAELVDDGMLLGLGSGSTVAFFLDALAERHLDVAGVPTSEATAARCRELALDLVAPADVTSIDLAVDGADELDHDLRLTKGGGGALVREKVVATLADRFVVIATTDKLVDRLAETFPLPVEVLRFAVGPVTRTLARLGFEVAERWRGGEPYRTDNGNAVLDCRFPGGLEDPGATDVAVTTVPGVVGTGLFVGLASSALLGDDRGEVAEIASRSA